MTARIKAMLCLIIVIAVSGCGAPDSSASSAQIPTPIAAKPAQESAASSDNAEPSAVGDPKEGAFDFYVLSLSWSPTYCLEKGDAAEPAQCAVTRPFDFVVHGLWPQLESGPAEECAVGGPRPNAALVSSMLDLMPSPGLIRHEWNAHGACSGLSPKAYFAAVRKARGVVQIPDAFTGHDDAQTFSPAEIEAMFVKKNTGLRSEGIAVTCSGRRLKEVRICLTKSLSFRTCSEVDRRACRRDEITAPAWRGG
ncbi:MAG: hypothetical protein ABWZ40_07135 [Caulobacterales bacterium]